MALDTRTPDDLEQDLLHLYRQLHDGLSDMIEGGRLTNADVPDDYSWLVSILTEASGLNGRLSNMDD